MGEAGPSEKAAMMRLAMVASVALANLSAASGCADVQCEEVCTSSDAATNCTADYVQGTPLSRARSCSVVKVGEFGVALPPSSHSACPGSG